MSSRLRFLRSPSGAIGLGLLVFIVLVALVGPAFAPHPPASSISASGAPPSSAFPLGTDYLGRDILSRLLWGGRSVLGLAIAATAASYAIGMLIGMTAGYSRSWPEGVLMRTVDVIRAFPPLLFFLIVVTGIGSSDAVLVLGVTFVQAPGIARLVHTVTKEVSLRAYVEAAVVRGESTWMVIRREVLPNILTPVIADLGLRFTFSILLVASVNFLGLGLNEPASDWGLMVSKNREIISLNPWATIAPAALIAMITIGVNLLGDAVARSLGHSEARVP